MKSKFKRILASALTSAVLVMTLPQAIASEILDKWTVPSTDGVDLRVGIVADSHIQNQTDVSSLTNALSAFEEMDSDMDAVAMVGDIVYTADSVKTLEEREALYTLMYSGWDGVFGTETPPQMVYAIGNHEMSLNTDDATKVALAKQAFVNKVGAIDRVYDVQGYTFITAGPKDYYGVLSEETEAFVMTNANAAIAKDPNKPVFLLIHHPSRDLYHGSTAAYKYYSEEFYEFLHSTPQIIMLSAHSHAITWDPRTITQIEGGYTTINVPYSGNSTMSMRGYSADSLWDTYYHWKAVSEAQVMEIKDNVVYIHRMDVKNKRYIGNPFVIDIPSMVAGTGGYNYTDARYDIATAPTYPEDAWVKVTESAAGTIDILFSNNAEKIEESAKGLNDNFVMGYKVTVDDIDGGYTVATKKIFGDFFSITPAEQKKTVVSGLQDGRSYRVSVAPVSAFDKVGNAVYQDITMSGEKAEYEKLAHWSMKKITSMNSADSDVYTGTGATTSVMLNDIDNKKYMLDLNAPGNYNPVLESISSIMYAQTDTKVIKPQSNLYGYYPVVGGGNLAEQLNDGFTIDTWMKFDTFGNGLIRINGADGQTKFTFYKEGNSSVAPLIIRRFYTDSEGNVTSDSKVIGRVDYKKWHHIVIVCGASDAYEDMTVYLNGKKVSLTKHNYHTASSSDTPIAFEKTDIMQFGGYADWAKATAVWLGETSVYGEKLDSGAVLDSYNASKVKFEPEFEIKLYNIFDQVIAFGDLTRVLADRTKMITVDVTAKAEGVTKDNFNIYCVEDKKNIDFDFSLDGTTAVIDGFTLETGKTYQFAVSNIKNSSGKFIRSEAQTITIKTITLAEKGISPILNYDFQSYTQASDKSNRYFYNTLDNTKYTLNAKIIDGGSVASHFPQIKNVSTATYTENEKTYLYPPYGKYGANRISDADTLAPKLNSAFTFETWVRPEISINETYGNFLFNIRESTLVQGSGSRKAKFSIEIKKSGSNYKFAVRNYFKEEDGSEKSNYAITKNSFPQKFLHLVVAYDPSSPTAEPAIYVNGELQAITKTYAASETATHIGFAGTDLIELGGLSSGWHASRHATLTISSGMYLADDVMYNYINSKDTYNYEYDVKLYSDNTLCTLSEIKTGKAYDYLTIGMGSADATLLSDDTVYIIDSDGDKASVTGTYDETTSLYTMDLSLLGAGEYTLVVDKSIYTLGSDSDFNLKFKSIPDKILINKCKVSEDGTITAEVYNGDTGEKTAVLMVGVYEGEKLTNAQAIELGSIGSGAKKPAAITIKSSEGKTVKLMLWDSLTKLTPYHTPITK